MIGALVLAVVLLVVLPVGVLVTGGALAALMGQALTRHATDTHPDSELTDLNT